MTDTDSNTSSYEGPERRSGADDRRAAKEDRRNEERLAQDPLPRRNPDQADRRNDDPPRSES